MRGRTGIEEREKQRKMTAMRRKKGREGSEELREQHSFTVSNHTLSYLSNRKYIIQ